MAAPSATLAAGVPIDVQRLVETRLLIQANSGAGKSWALRRLLEQTAGTVQQLVIDPEGEFQSLREAFDYVVCAPDGGDAIAHPRTAKLLARRLLETGVSAILNIYELKAHERQEFVRIFCDTLTNAPKSLWHPALVVLDEAHVYCPEKGKAASTGAVIDLATRGRKRGYGLVLATQRLSKLHKDAAAEAINKLIGRTGLDVDVKRAADELGLRPADAMVSLRALQAGDFYAFGPAFDLPAPRALHVGDVRTSHPKAGQRGIVAPPPPSERIRAAIAAGLQDLPREAEHEARTLEELRQELTVTRGKLTRAEKAAQAAGVPEREVQRREAAAHAQGRAEAAQPGVNGAVADRVLKFLGIAERALNDAQAHLCRAAPPLTRGPAPAAARASRSRVASPARGSGLVTGPQQRVLDALAKLDSLGVTPAPKANVAAFAGYSPNSGGFNNTLGSLRSVDPALLDYPRPGYVALTPAGTLLAQQPDTPATLEALHQAWIDAPCVSGPQGRILRALIARHPADVAKDELAAELGYAPNSGGWNNYLGALRSLGVIDYPRPGHVIATALLFPEAARNA